MASEFILAASMLSAAFAAGAAALLTYARLVKSKREQIRQIEARHAGQMETVGKAHYALRTALDAASARDAEKGGQLDHLEQENAWLRDELEKRPRIIRKTYKILTVGVRWTGKTSLTLKWANPLIDLGTLEGTKIERYERTVSQVLKDNSRMEHVFEIRDWGGEHIVDAQQELIMAEIHGLLLVVDLGGKDATRAEPARVQEQLRKFQAEALQFFFGPNVVSSCKAVVLFINKSDLLAGSPAEAEEQARALYRPLVDDLMKYSTQIDVRVLVGSASYGHSTHHLFAHFVEKILPRDAYDAQLLQRMQRDALGGRLPAAAAHDFWSAANDTPVVADHRAPGNNGYEASQGALVPRALVGT